MYSILATLSLGNNRFRNQFLNRLPLKNMFTRPQCRYKFGSQSQNFILHLPLAKMGVKKIPRKTKAQIIDGNKTSKDIHGEIKADIEKWVKEGHRAPCIIAILVGEDPASQTYVRKKMEAAKSVGIKSETVNLPQSISEIELMQHVNKLNTDHSVDGILVQLPLPSHISERNVCNAVVPEKDVDGFHIRNIGKLCLNMNTFVPCTPLGVVELLKRYKIPTFGKNVVICSRSKNIGLPLLMLLHSDAKNELPGMEATTVLCHRNTPHEDLLYFLKKADIVISATGIAGMIKADMIKPGACVIDVGIIRVKTPDGKTKLVGDVDYPAVSEVAGYITPVPGGVGPMTVAMLMKNTYDAAMRIAKSGVH